MQSGGEPVTLPTFATVPTLLLPFRDNPLKLRCVGHETYLAHFSTTNFHGDAAAAPTAGPLRQAAFFLHVHSSVEHKNWPVRNCCHWAQA